MIKKLFKRYKSHEKLISRKKDFFFFQQIMSLWENYYYYEY